jgi:hypothetical protein
MADQSTQPKEQLLMPLMRWFLLAMILANIAGTMSRLLMPIYLIRAQPAWLASTVKAQYYRVEKLRLPVPQASPSHPCGACSAYVEDITNPSAPVMVMQNLQLHRALKDGGIPSRPDILQATLWKGEIAIATN